MSYKLRVMSGIKKPYLKKYKTAGGFDVWIVDGNYIRREINKEFTNFDQHLRFSFIPKNEFWIDKEYGRSNEKDFFITHLLTENRLMKKGVSYIRASNAANRAETAERTKSATFRRLKGDARDGKKILQNIHRRLFKKYGSKLKVWVVDGEAVRDVFFIDFTEGGHSRVYPFVPPGEIWLDDDVNPRERGFVLIHEIHEYNLMGRGWPYVKAHKSASELEWRCRHNPKFLKKGLKKEFKKIKV